MVSISMLHVVRETDLHLAFWTKHAQTLCVTMFGEFTAEERACRKADYN